MSCHLNFPLKYLIKFFGYASNSDTHLLTSTNTNLLPKKIKIFISTKLFTQNTQFGFNFYELSFSPPHSGLFFRFPTKLDLFLAFSSPFHSHSFTVTKHITQPSIHWLFLTHTHPIKHTHTPKFITLLFDFLHFHSILLRCFS